MTNQSDESADLRNSRAVKLLFRHQDSLRAYIQALRPQCMAYEDIFQSVWAEVLGSQLPSNDGECLPWILAVARNCVIRDRRKNRLMNVNHEDAEEAAAKKIAEGFVRVAERYELDRQKEAFSGGLGSLNAHDRALLRAYYSTKQGAKETLAQELGLSMTRLYTEIRRIRDKLKNYVQVRLAQENPL